MLDNSELIAPFCPDVDDGDTFIYTEMLDRSNRKGNNGHRLLKTFYHRSRAEFWEQLPHIKRLCDLSGVRACTRLSPRSFKKVGKKFTELVVDAALTDNWAGMKSLYNRACGIVSPEFKYWIWDVDVVSKNSALFGKWLKHTDIRAPLQLLVSEIPSKKGVHYISRPFDPRVLPHFVNGLIALQEIQLHKDNPTNLYIPDNAT